MTSFTRRNLGIAAGMATAVALTAGAMISFSANAAEPGVAAPTFTGTTSSGDVFDLADYSDKTVVLEWTNHDCPFVIKHYSEPVKNMQTLQADATSDDVIWVQIISSAPGKQGHVSGAEADALNTDRGAAVSYTILDTDGEIGRAYAAKTTPHMFVIDQGDLAYAGAIDSVRSARVSDIAEATNYVTAALGAVAVGGSVETVSTKPYGCSVKY